MASQITVSYTSPTSTNIFASPLKSNPTSIQSLQDKSDYLADLRTKVTQMQDDMNVFLTQKMDQDKAAEAGTNAKDEDMEEQMYGEEVVDED